MLQCARASRSARTLGLLAQLARPPGWSWSWSWSWSWFRRWSGEGGTRTSAALCCRGPTCPRLWRGKRPPPLPG
eukprot:2962064-Pyramimonas_sp.AAC.1